MRRNSSIAKQMAGIFIALMAIILGVNVLVNNLFLEKYYTRRLQQILFGVYTQLDEHVEEEEIDSSLFDGDFAKTCYSYNISLVVLDQQFQFMLGNSEVMAGRIFGNITGIEKDPAEIIRQTDQYTLQKKTDQKMQMGYLEMWGTLTCGNYFMLRIPLEAINNSAGIAVDFILRITLAALPVCILLIVLFSRRIAKPIRELEDISKRMANLDFDAKYTSGGKNEIGRLGEHFNRMSETLESTISQLKSANASLQQDIERKTKIDEMRREFLSNVSHELKTPIALIQGYAEGLKECVNDDPESRMFYCDVIMDEAGKMNRLVKQLLTLNQLESGTEPTQMQRFDIAQLIRGKIQAVGILAEQKGAEILYEGAQTIHVWGDEFRIEEVLTNYISNALNHVEGQMRITIRACRTQDKVRISVINTGAQIPEEELPSIWDKFYKVDKARTREYGGSGVGLSIVRAIMDSHNQRYGAENLDDGVEFWFELDCADGLEED